jgi:translation initiation factor IF-3
MKIRLVGDNIQPGIYDYAEAEKLASKLELDLFKISSGKDGTGVYKILDKQKYLYEKKKQQKDNKKGKVVVKEIRITPTISDNDLNTKIKQAETFGKKGYRLKVGVFFKGRAIKVQMDEGQTKLLKIADSLSEYYKASSMPKMEGRRLTINLNPKK